MELRSNSFSNKQKRTRHNIQQISLHYINYLPMYPSCILSSTSSYVLTNGYLGINNLQWMLFLKFCICVFRLTAIVWRRGSCQSLAGRFSPLTYAWSTVDVTTSWINCPLWVSQPRQLSLLALWVSNYMDYGVETIKRQTMATYGWLVAGQSLWARAWTAANAVRALCLGPKSAPAAAVRSLRCYISVYA